MMTMVTVVKMTVEAWIAVKDNPKQRDTARHAQKAVNKHLKEVAATQSVVAAAQVLGGEMYKLDGHTRSLLWSDGRLARPSHVDVMVYPCATIEEAIALYDTFDNPGAVDTTADALHSAFRLAGYTPQSGLLKEGGVVTAFRLLHWSAHCLVQLVAYWREELIALDRLGLTKKSLNSAGIATSLLAVREYGQRGLEFVSKVATNDGIRIEGKSCGVDEACRLLLEKKGKVRSSTPAQRIIASKLMGCCVRWMANRMSDRASKSVDLSAWMTEHDIWSVSEIARGERGRRYVGKVVDDDE
jgi:hypothetical protein